jgi:hypothetical protein
MDINTDFWAWHQERSGVFFCAVLLTVCLLLQKKQVREHWLEERPEHNSTKTEES